MIKVKGDVRGKNTMLKISEMFFSVQGEGPTIGIPSVFIRLSGCNLLCGAPNMLNVKDKTDQFEINQQKDKNAKWVCDTIAVWLKGTMYEPEKLYDEWKTRGWIDKIKNGAHIVATGGEPTNSQTGLIDFFKLFPTNTYIEIETNGTIQPIEEFDKYVSQYNCSPKLSNSAMSKERRYIPTVLQWYCNNPKSNFKFVTLDDEDTTEIINDFIEPFNIPKNKIFLMPGSQTREELIKNSVRVAELCKENNWRYSTRLQLEIYNRKTGV